MDNDFTENVRRAFACRNGNLCSNPDCRALLPPNTEKAGVVIPIARLDPGRDPDDGILLCQNCATLVGNHPTQYPEVLLRAWKIVAEHHALSLTAKTPSGARTPSSVPPESESQRKTRAILPWKGKVVTLAERLAGGAAGHGPTLAYSVTQVLDCTESHVTVSRTWAESEASSISLKDIELGIDATANQLELRVRSA